MCYICTCCYHRNVFLLVQYINWKHFIQKVQLWQPCYSNKWGCWACRLNSIKREWAMRWISLVFNYFPLVLLTQDSLVCTPTHYRLLYMIWVLCLTRKTCMLLTCSRLCAIVCVLLSTWCPALACINNDWQLAYLLRYSYAHAWARPACAWWNLHKHCMYVCVCVCVRVYVSIKIHKT